MLNSTAVLGCGDVVGFSVNKTWLTGGLSTWYKFAVFGLGKISGLIHPPVRTLYILIQLSNQHLWIIFTEVSGGFSAFSTTITTLAASFYKKKRSRQ